MPSYTYDQLIHEAARLRTRNKHWIAARLWKDRNPGPWSEMVAIADKQVAAGRRFSFKAIAEFIRWGRYFDSGERFKLANAYVSYLAREYLISHPEAARLIDLRRMA